MSQHDAIGKEDVIGRQPLRFFWMGIGCHIDRCDCLAQVQLRAIETLADGTDDRHRIGLAIAFNKDASQRMFSLMNPDRLP